MAITNRERVGKALDLLNEGLLPFAEREMKAVYADRWEEVAREGQGSERGKGRKAEKLHLDCHALLTVMWNQWNPVFSKTLGQSERSLVNELREVRNNWAHHEGKRCQEPLLTAVRELPGLDSNFQLRRRVPRDPLRDSWA
jgi:hypothetical protein